MEENGFAARLKLAIGESSTRAFAKKAGISEALMRQCVAGKSEPTRPKLVAIARAAGVHLDWLATGQEPMYEIDSEENYVYIPLYDICTSAGSGAFVDHEAVVDHLAFKRSWVKNSLRSNPENLSLVYVVGDSMEPELKSDDMIMVEHSVDSMVPRDAIFVIRIDGELYVKRLQRLPEEKVRVISTNPAYEPFYVNLKDVEDENYFAIIGRVVWVGSKK